MNHSKKRINWYFTCLCCLLSLSAKAQSLKTTTGQISFSVSAPAKTIKGESKTAFVAVNIKSGEVSVKVAVKSFAFYNNFVSDTLNALIRQRFNDYYMESTRFPEVEFQGKIDLTGKTKAAKLHPFTGKLTLHGVTRDVTGNVLIGTGKGPQQIKALLHVVPSEYDIRIPPYIGYMYFKEVDITLDASLY